MSNDAINQHCRTTIKNLMPVLLNLADKQTVDPALTNVANSVNDSFAKLQALRMLEGAGLSNIVGGQNIDQSELGQVFSGVTAAKNANRGASLPPVPSG